jgi:CubicO group peptidase (beta-lactamase class C family)
VPILSQRLIFYALSILCLVASNIAAGALTLEPPKKNSPTPLDTIDERVLGVMQRQHIPGLALGVYQVGSLLKAEGYGWANLETKEPVQPDTVFQLQSVTKSFTATAVMLLVEQGKLGLEDRLTNFVAGCPDLWSNITVRRLLTHTSGIKDFINEPTIPLNKDITPEAVVASLDKLPLNFAPGEKYTYSNTGYHLLGMIIRKVTGKKWEDFLRERIFAPLAMRHTDINSATCSLPRRAAGYSWNNDTFQPGRYIAPSILGYAGGGMLSTINDLALWDAALHAHRILKPATQAQMWVHTRLNGGDFSTYGFGWQVNDYRGHRFLAHGGAHVSGFRSTFLHFHEDKLTIVVLANQFRFNPDEIGLWVARQYLPDTRLNELPEKPDPSPALTQNLKTCLAGLARKRDSARITPAFRAEYAKTPDRAKTLADRLEKMTAFAFLASHDVRDRQIFRFGDPILRVCFYKMVAGAETRYYTFYLTAGEQVAFYQSSED